MITQSEPIGAHCAYFWKAQLSIQGSQYMTLNTTKQHYGPHLGPQTLFPSSVHCGQAQQIEQVFKRFSQLLARCPVVARASSGALVMKSVLGSADSVRLNISADSAIGCTHWSLMASAIWTDQLLVTPPSWACVGHVSGMFWTRVGNGSDMIPADVLQCSPHVP